MLLGGRQSFGKPIRVVAKIIPAIKLRVAGHCFTTDPKSLTQWSIQDKTTTPNKSKQPMPAQLERVLHDISVGRLVEAHKPHGCVYIIVRFTFML